MSVLTWWRDLRNGLKRVEELKVIESAKIAELHSAIEKGECADLDAATLCIESITLDLKKRGMDKIAKKEGIK